MENADYLLLASASIAASLVCFASPVFGRMWRGDWEWPGWTIGALLRGRRARSGLQAHIAGRAPGRLPEPGYSDPLASYSVGWVFLALALALLAAAGLQAAVNS